MGMHGPEHHMADGAAFLTAMHNAGAVFDLKEALDEMERRGAKMPGATCGQWGVCGSASSVGAALSIIHQTGPLSDNEFYKDNLRFTSMSFCRLADIGDPRCCKRNAFICVHNSCRSQMAEALAKSLASDVFISYSAGTETKPCINQDAVRIMKDMYGIDMELTQYSKLLSEIPPVDIVITMGCNVDSASSL